MLTPASTTAFKKDLKKIATRGWDITKLIIPLVYLLNRKPLPPQYNDHPLKGDWLGYRNIHIETDWIFIYRVNGDDLILSRTGSHSDLFKK